MDIAGHQKTTMRAGSINHRKMLFALFCDINSIILSALLALIVNVIAVKRAIFRDGMITVRTFKTGSSDIGGYNTAPMALRAFCKNARGGCCIDRISAIRLINSSFHSGFLFYTVISMRLSSIPTIQLSYYPSSVVLGLLMTLYPF